MARTKQNQTLLFEELEPRLLFSADAAESLAAQAAEEQIEQAPIVIIAESTGQQEAAAENGAENPADSSSAAVSQEQSSSDTFVITDNDSGNEAPPSEPESSVSDEFTGDTEQASETSAEGETDSNTDTDHSIVSTTGSESDSPILSGDTTSQQNALVLVNDNVRDIDELIAGIDKPDSGSSDFEIVILDSGQDGIDQVSEILSTRDNLDAIHIFSHGRDGQLALGSDWLDSEDLRENSAVVSEWGEALTENGDILLYGCSISAGESGQDLVDLLADLTQADVSGSDDSTGHSDLGGDWDLEYTTGTLETSVPLDTHDFLSWNHVLAATISDDFNDLTYGGNTGSVSWNNDWQEIGESDGATDGNVSIFTSFEFGNAVGIDIWKKPCGIWREANLLGASTATLSFDWGMLYTDDLDTVTLEISTDGGSTWNLLETWAGPLTHGSLQHVDYDITSYIDDDTRIKFETVNFGDNDQFFLDNVLIDFNTSVITVTTEADILDGDTNSISELIDDPGDDGKISLREAIEAANHTSGLDRITFNIPGTGPHILTIDQDLNALPYITDAVYIDGTSEPDYVDAPVIQIDGSDLSDKGGDNYDGFQLEPGSDGSTIRGLSITGFTDGNNWGQAFDIRTDDNTIVGNYIGIAPDGTTPDGNRIGVMLHNGAGNNIIGGTSDADKNLISASIYAGINVVDDISGGNRIIGNDIGLDANGDTVVSGTFGVLVWDGSSNNVIGGVNPGEGNRITGHREGIVIDDNGNTAFNNAILGNEIWDNREMAIDLGNDGITDNDIDDADSGPNDELNFPVITNVNQNGSDLELSFNLEVPSGDYRIEFFENPNGINGTGLGEGQTFLGAVTITSNGNGFELFNEVLSGITVTNPATVAATATEYLGGTAYGSTSEFGPATTTQTILSAVKDTYLDDDNDENNYGDSSILLIDKSGGELGDGRTLLQFDFGTIPVGAEITGAVLQLNALSNTGPFAINVYELTEDWDEGSGSTGAADWDYRKTPESVSTEWSTPGGTVDPAVIASLTTGDTGIHSWDVTTLVQDWFTGTAVNNGLMLASPDSGGETVTYDSREGGIAPQLILTYSLPVNTAPGLDPAADVVLNPVLQDNGPPSGAVGTLVEDLVDLSGGGGLDNVTDPDSGAVTGIAITQADTGNGSWYYSVDDGANWLVLGSVDPNNARLLAADAQTRIYFEAAAGFSGTIAEGITFRAWDQTVGTNGDLGDTTSPGGTSAFSPAQDTAAITVNDTNDPPTLSLTNIITTLPESSDTSSPTKVADIVVSDDVLGTNELSLSGADSSLFSIVGTELFLNAGVSLDYESNPRLDVTVEVDDTTIGAGIDDTAALSITVTDVNEAPTVSLSNTLTSMPEDYDTASPTRVADIVVTDDGLGTNTLGLSGADSSLFTIVGTELFLNAGVSLDYESNPDLDVTVAVDDTTIGAGVDDTALISISITDVNEAPTVSLANTTVNVPEDIDTASPTKVADIVVSDDGLGTNTLGLSGADSSLFTIVGTELFLNAGVSLDYESNPDLDVTVAVDDTTIGAGIDDTAALSISVTDINEAPTVSLANTTATLPEDYNSASPTKVADIVVTDDVLGTNTLGLSGADASLFTIVGTELFLNAGVSLDHESNPDLDVTVAVDDTTIGAGIDDTAALSITVTDINEAPTVSLSNALTSMPEDSDTASPTKVADIVVTDDGLGTNTLTLSGADASLFSIVGTELFLNAGVSLDYETDPNLDIVLEINDVTVGTTPDHSIPLTITVSDVGELPVAQDDSSETTSNITVTTGNVLGNDIFGDGTTAVSNFDSLSSSGATITYNNDGTFNYAPATDFVGNDTFTYTISDSDGEMSTAIVSVMVTPLATGGPVPVDPDPVEPSDPETEVTDPTEPAESVEPEELPTAQEPVLQTESSEPSPAMDSVEEPTEPVEPAVADNDGDTDKSKDAASSAKGDSAAGAVAQDPEMIARSEDGEIIVADIGETDQSHDTSTASRETGELKKTNLDTSSTTTLLLKRYLDHMNVLDEMEYTSAINQLRDALDEFKDEATSEEHYYKTVIGSAIAVSTGLSVGYVVWLIRGGMLLSSMLFSMPAWQLADPLPLLAGGRDDDDEDEETLETMIRDSDETREKGKKIKDKVENEARS